MNQNNFVSHRSGHNIWYDSENKFERYGEIYILGLRHSGDYKPEINSQRKKSSKQINLK